ncbi:hypothetical protein FRB94_000069 [Tulasnella sp. JGI-2019a]|nr:hypothetical protein FRB94_000069 [Tulasnella sp. JGI-2019a]
MATSEHYANMASQDSRSWANAYTEGSLCSTASSSSQVLKEPMPPHLSVPDYYSPEEFSPEDTAYEHKQVTKTQCGELDTSCSRHDNPFTHPPIQSASAPLTALEKTEVVAPEDSYSSLEQEIQYSGYWTTYGAYVESPL